MHNSKHNAADCRSSTQLLFCDMDETNNLTSIGKMLEMILDEPPLFLPDVVCPLHQKFSMLCFIRKHTVICSLYNGPSLYMDLAAMDAKSQIGGPPGWK